MYFEPIDLNFYEEGNSDWVLEAMSILRSRRVAVFQTETCDSSDQQAMWDELTTQFEANGPKVLESDGEREIALGTIEGKACVMYGTKGYQALVMRQKDLVKQVTTHFVPASFAPSKPEPEQHRNVKRAGP